MKALSALSCLILAAATSGLAAQTPVATAADAPDLKRGRLLFIHCRACHDVKAGLPHKVGPNLNGMMGRKAGTAAGFTQYSPALRAWGQTWDVALLDKWIEKPSSVVPGNSMVYVGLTQARDRAALISYLQAESRAPTP